MLDKNHYKCLTLYVTNIGNSNYNRFTENTVKVIFEKNNENEINWQSMSIT